MTKSKLAYETGITILALIILAILMVGADAILNYLTGWRFVPGYWTRS